MQWVYIAGHGEVWHPAVTDGLLLGRLPRPDEAALLQGRVAFSVTDGLLVRRLPWPDEASQ